MGGRKEENEKSVDFNIKNQKIYPCLPGSLLLPQQSKNTKLKRPSHENAKRQLEGSVR